jgi:hypothetical protein
MSDKVNLKILARNGDELMDALGRGEMVAAYSKGQFLYILAADDRFQLFSHTVGAASGGRKSFPIDEKHRAIVKTLASMAESLYSVGFAANMDIYGVMASAEEAVCAMFPEYGAADAGDIEFVIPGENAQQNRRGV